MVQTAREGAATPRVRERKREILRAASRLFRSQGLHSTGMRDIAAAAGMAVGNLYYYFRDKQELLAFCQEDALDGLLALAAEVRALPEPADRKLHRLIDTFAESVPAVPFDAEAAGRFGLVAAALARAGTPIGILDTLIAAQALARELTLVSNNTEHFKRVAGLKLENWL